jgi:peroxiredoxin
MLKLLVSVTAVAMSVSGCAQGPNVRRAPELAGTKWLNQSVPLTLAGRKGQVSIVHFWTFACSNCIANLAAYDRLYKKYKPLGVEMVGIHTPELPRERSEENVAKAVKDLGIKFPVLLDPDGKNWMAFKQEVWPTVYVIDKRGQIRYTWVGEFAYQGRRGEAEVTRWIDYLLKERA